MAPPRSRAIALLKEAQRRKAQDPETYLSDLFPEQRKFVEDPSRHKAALCSRRAGKTHAAVVSLILAAQDHPGVTVLYLALTRESAKKLAWKPLIAFNDQYQLGLKFQHSELEATLPNGSIIKVAGADDVRRVERLRGDKYKLAIIDESQSFRPSILAYLRKDILRLSLVDYRGTLILMGTPGPAPTGLFYDVTTGSEGGWSVHRWTIFDNPFIPHAAEEFEEEKRQNRWNEDHPTLQREWLGRWVRDLGSLVYPYSPERNRIDRLPSYTSGEWRHALGIDFGVTNATAFVVVAWHENDPTLYIVESESKTGVIPSEAAEIVKDYQRRYDFSRIVGDIGGLGKAFSEEMRRRHAIPVQPAQKADKRGFQELMGGDLTSGLIKVIGPKNQTLIDEWQTIQWTADRSKEDDRYSNHAADAALYVWREAKHYTAEIPVPPRTSPLSEDEIRAEIVRKEQEALERLRRPKNEEDDWFADLTGGGGYDYMEGF